MSNKGDVAVIGAGAMGTAIATLYAAHGYRVRLHDQTSSQLKSYRERATPTANWFANSRRTSDEILNNVVCSESLSECVKDAFLVQETIHEELQAKRSLFRSLDLLCSPSVILGSNTSSFLISEISDGLEGRERIIGIHYVAPAHLIRAIEIITASFTPASLIQKVRDFVNSVDHVGIVCHERPGFLINRIQYALKAEAQRLVEDGIASVEDIDAAVRLSIGPRLALWGPMMQEDLCASKNTVVAVSEYLHGATGESHFAGTATLRELAQQGHTGAAAGLGWYQWDADHGRRAAERDKQLGDLLLWLRSNDRLTELGVRGPNKKLPEVK